jgi:acetyl-CoA C-acetyltransferase
VDPDAVGHVVFGNVIHTEVRDMYLARVAAVNGGLAVQTPALTLNRLCGSGLQAIVSAAQAVRLGDCEVAVAGGAESILGFAVSLFLSLRRPCLSSPCRSVGCGAD